MKPPRTACYRTIALTPGAKNLVARPNQGSPSHLNRINDVPGESIQVQTPSPVLTLPFAGRLR